MREIKFRAWDAEEKNFIYFDALDGILSKCDETYRQRCVGKFEQFTGLYDKNGKEIYEGDIIAYGVTKAVIEWINIFSAFKCCSCMDKVDPFEWPLHKEYAREGFEVIGNIYSNPELLND